MSRNFLFDELLPFADDPEAFDRKRLEILERELSKLPEDKQLKARQIQWRIDGQLRGLKGMARYNKMVQLFWNGFFEFKEAIDQLRT